jgi:hypothetical protein
MGFGLFCTERIHDNVLIYVHCRCDVTDCSSWHQGPSSLITEVGHSRQFLDYIISYIISKLIIGEFPSPAPVCPPPSEMHEVPFTPDIHDNLGLWNMGFPVALLLREGELTGCDKKIL